MEIHITSSKENPLLKRKEVEFRVDHGPNGKTPTRFEAKKALATELKVNENMVFIKKMRSMTGTNIAVGNANAYQTIEQAKLVEPEYIIKRNSPPKPKEEEA